MDELEVAFSHQLAKRTDCNHIFLNFGPTVIMDPAKVEIKGYFWFSSLSQLCRTRGYGFGRGWDE